MYSNWEWKYLTQSETGEPTPDTSERDDKGIVLHAKIEFEECYRQLRHYHNLQYLLLRIYLAIFFGGWAAHLFLLDRGFDSSRFVLISVTLLAELVILFMFVANRFPFTLHLKRVGFLRRTFLHKPSELWTQFPLFYRSVHQNGEVYSDYRVMRFQGTFFSTAILAAFGNSLLLFVGLSGSAELQLTLNIKDVMTSAIFFIAQLLAVVVYSFRLDNDLIASSGPRRE